jgi:hypothetical protein
MCSVWCQYTCTLLKEPWRDVHRQPNQNSRKKIFLSDIRWHLFNDYILPLRILIYLIWNLYQKWVKETSIFKFLHPEISKSLAWSRDVDDDDGANNLDHVRMRNSDLT